MVDRPAVIAAIDAVLKAITDPKPQVVYSGEPANLPNNVVFAYWYNGDTPYSKGGAEGKTLGNAMVDEWFTIRAYFPYIDSPQLRNSVEADIWSAVRNIKAGFRGGSTLGGLVTDLDLSDAVIEWIVLGGGGRRRIATMSLQIHDLEAETIAP